MPNPSVFPQFYQLLQNSNPDHMNLLGRSSLPSGNELGIFPLLLSTQMQIAQLMTVNTKHL